MVAGEKYTNGQRRSVNPEKMTTWTTPFSVTSIRYGKKPRLLLTYKETTEKRHPIYIEDLAQHEYHDAATQRSTHLEESLENFEECLAQGIFAPISINDVKPVEKKKKKQKQDKQAKQKKEVKDQIIKEIIEEMIDKATDDSLVDITEEETDQKDDLYYSDGKFIKPTAEQLKSFNEDDEEYIYGAAGAGKTLTAIAKLEKAYDKGRNVLYVTQSTKLANKERNKIEDKYVLSKTHRFASYDYDALLKFIDPSLKEKTMVGEEEFNAWLQSYLNAHKNEKIPAGILKAKNLIYKELRNLSGYSKKERLSTGDDKLGEHERLFLELEEKEYLEILRKEYKKEVKSKPIYDQSFYKIKDYSLFKDFVVAIDEIDNFSTLQIKQLLHLGKLSSISGDSNQLTDDLLPKRPFIKRCLGSRGIKYTPLKASKRNAKSIIAEANKLLRLIYAALGGKLEKDSYDEIETPADAEEGKVEWIKNTPQTLNEFRKKTVKAGHVILTHKELIAEAKENFPGYKVYSFDQYKGMEKDHVTLYEPYSTDECAKLDGKLPDIDNDPKKKYNLQKHRDMAVLSLIPELRKIFVGYTRPIKSLTIIQSDKHKARHIIERMRPVPAPTPPADPAATNNVPTPSVSITEKQPAQDFIDTEKEDPENNLNEAIINYSKGEIEIAMDMAKDLPEVQRKKFDIERDKLEANNAKQRARELEREEEQKRQLQQKNEKAKQQTSSLTSSSKGSIGLSPSSSSSSANVAKKISVPASQKIIEPTAVPSIAKTKEETALLELVRMVKAASQYMVNAMIIDNDKHSCALIDEAGDESFRKKLIEIYKDTPILFESLPFDVLFKPFKDKKNSNRQVYIISVLLEYPELHAILKLWLGKLNEEDEQVDLLMGELLQDFTMGFGKKSLKTSFLKFLAELHPDILLFLVEKYKTFSTLLANNILADMTSEKSLLRLLCKSKVGCKIINVVAALDKTFLLKIPPAVMLNFIKDTDGPDSNFSEAGLNFLYSIITTKSDLCEKIANENELLEPYYINDTPDNIPLKNLYQILMQSETGKKIFAELRNANPRITDEFIASKMKSYGLDYLTADEIMRIEKFKQTKSVSSLVEIMRQPDTSRLLTSKSGFKDATTLIWDLMNNEEMTAVLHDTLQQNEQLIPVFIRGLSNRGYSSTEGIAHSDFMLFLKNNETRKVLRLLKSQPQYFVAYNVAELFKFNINDTLAIEHLILDKTLHWVLETMCSDKYSVCQNNSLEFMSLCLGQNTKDTQVKDKLATARVLSLVFQHAPQFALSLALQLEKNSNVNFSFEYLFHGVADSSGINKFIPSRAYWMMRYKNEEAHQYMFNMFNNNKHLFNFIPLNSCLGLPQSDIHSDDKIAPLDSLAQTDSGRGIIRLYAYHLSKNDAPKLQVLVQLLVKAGHRELMETTFKQIDEMANAAEALSTSNNPVYSKTSFTDEESNFLVRFKKDPSAMFKKNNNQSCEFLTKCAEVSFRSTLSSLIEKSSDLFTNFSINLLFETYKDANNKATNVFSALFNYPVFSAVLQSWLSNLSNNNIASLMEYLSRDFMTYSGTGSQKSTYLKEMASKRPEDLLFLVRKYKQFSSLLAVEILKSSDIELFRRLSGSTVGYQIINEISKQDKKFLAKISPEVMMMPFDSLDDLSNNFSLLFGSEVQLRDEKNEVLLNWLSLSDDKWTSFLNDAFDKLSPFHLHYMTKVFIPFLINFQDYSGTSIFLRLLKKYPRFIEKLLKHNNFYFDANNESMFRILCVNPKFHPYLIKVNWDDFSGFNFADFFLEIEVSRSDSTHKLRNIPYYLTFSPQGLELLYSIVAARTDICDKLARQKELFTPYHIPNVPNATDKPLRNLYQLLMQSVAGKKIFAELRKANKLITDEFITSTMEYQLNPLTNDELAKLFVLKRDLSVNKLAEFLRQSDSRRLLNATSDNDGATSLIWDLMNNAEMIAVLHDTLAILHDTLESNPDLIPLFIEQLRKVNHYSREGDKLSYMPLLLKTSATRRILSLLESHPEYFTSCPITELFSFKLSNLVVIVAMLSDKKLHWVLEAMCAGENGRANAINFVTECMSGKKISENQTADHVLSLVFTASPKFALLLLQQMPLEKRKDLFFSISSKSFLREFDNARFYCLMAYPDAHKDLLTFLKSDPDLFKYMPVGLLHVGAPPKISLLDFLVQTKEGQDIIRVYIEDYLVEKKDVTKLKALEQLLEKHGAYEELLALTRKYISEISNQIVVAAEVLAGIGMK